MALYTQAERQRRWRVKHPEKVRAWGRRGVLRLKLRKYGKTLEWFDKTVARLNNICPGCKHPKNHKLNWMIDHCHKTGKFRGLLCGHCNSTLGHARDEPRTLRRLARYLERRRGA